MAWQMNPAEPAAADGRRGLPDTKNDERHRLIRCSHIFGSTVRELLEIRLLEAVGAGHLTLQQFHLLRLITLNGSHQIGQIADSLRVSAPAASQIVDKLARLGLVTRTRSERDRRVTLLTSSSEGHRLVERFRALEIERLEPVLGEFSGAELAQLEGLLERFSTALIRSEESVDGLCIRCAGHFESDCPIGHFHHSCPYQRLAESEGGDSLQAAS